MKYWILSLFFVSSIASAQYMIQLPKALDIKISDGDTVSFRSQGQNIRIRLAGIDAPESQQAFGRESAANLRNCLHSGNQIQAIYHKKDQYGRLIGKVLVDGRDCNLYQVQTGYAWWYADFASEQTPSDRSIYKNAQDTAQSRRLGLWSSGNAIPPWQWRKLNK